MTKVGRFMVLPTRDRSRAHDDYLAVVSPEIARELQLGSHGVVAYAPPALQGQLLVSACRVLIDSALGVDEIRLDQTVRHSIGLKYGGDRNSSTRVDIFPLRLTNSQWLRLGLSRVLGVRRLFARASKCSIADLEKGICRLPADVFSLLGCEPGDRVVIEAPRLTSGGYCLASIAVHSLEAPEHWLEQRRAQEECSVAARYPSAEGLLQVSPDVHRSSATPTSAKCLHFSFLVR